VSEAVLEPELIDEERIAAVAASLDLRDPNRRALRSIADAVAYHYRVAEETEPLECVVDAATGVGKTFILAAAIDYFAAQGVRNFAVITPGQTILRKTVANFTPGHPKSLLAGMETKPVVITSENFDSPKIAAAFEEENEVKLYVFTIQSLTAPAGQKAHKRTHSFQEGLGAAFYEHLTSLDDLIVFADEHHTYYGPAFSAAIRDLEPYALIGLTATPHPDTPEEQIIFRYPLAAGIAEKLVKTPVIVGRKDDRDDIETKLQDGLRLLEAKKTLADQYAATHRLEKINPVMLVVAATIEAANEVAEIVKREEFLDGRYADHVLVVTSKEKDKEKTLELLEGIEDPDSNVRVLVSVGMLKEGWDAKNVYVLVSLRPSISDILTEQTLGRGLRLPFGRYTDEQLLDTLEVLAHERYETLLKKADVINEAFIDVETRAALRAAASGELVLEKESETVGSEVEVEDEGTAETGTLTGPIITTTEAREAEAVAESSEKRVELVAREGARTLRVPILEMQPVESKFSLNDITNLDPFKKLGERLAHDPEDELRRELLTAEIVIGADGLRETILKTEAAGEAVESAPTLIPLETAKTRLVELILASPVVPARPAEKKAAERVVDEFVRGIGVDAPSVLSRYLGRAGGRLIKLITSQAKKALGKPDFNEVLEVIEFNPTRIGRAATSGRRTGKFQKVGYTGWSERSRYDQVWFDSGTELDVANILDKSNEVTHWVRLHRDDLPILWSSGGSWYHPDFLAIDSDGVHWVIEAKSNRDLESEDVQAKREAAQRWANHVSADEKVAAEWRYLLVSEDDVKSAKGDWGALKALASS
jgi:type III restriction enzyme